MAAARSSEYPPRLIADIGGTHSRFAISTQPRCWEHFATLPTASFATLTDAIEHYLAAIPGVQVDVACLAIAAPVEGDQVIMTNGHWAFSVRELQQHFHWAALRVINDFTAVALSLPALQPEQLVAIGTPTAHRTEVADLPLCVLGPGTGFGAAQLIPAAADWIPVSTEAGHVLISASNPMEIAVLEYWMQRDLYPSRENLLSGPGIFRLYQACCAIHDAPQQATDEVEVTQLAMTHRDAIATRTLAMYFGLLGSSCGDQALATGSRGGLYLAGGILPHLAEALCASSFRQRFEQKGPMSHYVQAIPTRLIITENPGLIGATRCALPPVAGHEN